MNCMSCRASAEEAMRMLNGSQLGGNAMRLSWFRRAANKQVASVACLFATPSIPNYRSSLVF